ncbi:hypothetical protein BX616_011330, partial [Lobosporangium transversale]
MFILGTISVPPWHTFKSTSIASVCALEAKEQGANPSVEGLASLHSNHVPPYSSMTETLGQRQQQIHRQNSLALSSDNPKPSFLESMSAGDDFEDYKSGAYIGTNGCNRNNKNCEAAYGYDKKEQRQSRQKASLAFTPYPSPPSLSTPSPPSSELSPEQGDDSHIATLSEQRSAQTYYARLSAPPGTKEAKAQHAAVLNALETLPGRVVIRHEFGIDEDDVLNVISFRLEGGADKLEDVAALDGVIGIYPVRTRKRPRELPLGPLKAVRPHLQSAHILTG